MKTVFVFGSNTGGIHGSGAALTAYKKHGARWGMGYGHYGNSFAIPTKGHRYRVDGDPSGDVFIGDTLLIGFIHDFVRGFLAYARSNPDIEFQVTRIGCGLAGLKDKDVAPLFFTAPSNCSFDDKWADYLPTTAKFWGTYR